MYLLVTIATLSSGRPLNLDAAFSKFLDMLGILFSHRKFERVCRILRNLEPEDSLFKTRFNQYLQQVLSLVSYIQTDNEQKDFKLTEIFKI